MRKMLPIALVLLGIGCSLPKRHDVNLVKKPAIPYVDPADRLTLQRELAFEPESALFAPDRGLQLSTDLLAQARTRQAPACLLEIGAGQGGELCRRALGQGWRKAMVHQDMSGHDRVLIALA